MAQDVVYSGPLNGRFFKVSPVLQPGRSLVDVCLEHAWSAERSAGSPSYRSFCRSAVPHDGDLGEDPDLLSYDDDGTGVWRLWLREESRKAGRAAIEERAAELVVEQYPDTPLLKLQRSEKKDILARAKRDLLRMAVPSIRIIPLVAMSGWVWIGRRACAKDRTYVHLLRQVFSSLELDPLLWDPDEAGWTSCSYATLLAFVRSTNGELAPDVVLSEIDVRGRAIQLKAADSAEDVRAVLREVTKSTSEASVSRLSFEVYRDGTSIVLDADEHGLHRGAPAKSAGGLPHERISRRFGDVRYASGRVREVMMGLVKQLEETA